MLDFSGEFGANAAFVADLFGRWSQDPASVSSDWDRYFRRMAPDVQSAPPRPRGRTRETPTRVTPPAEGNLPEVEVEPLRGVLGRIVQNMEQSLSIPTATSVRTVAVKLLEENRALLNRHLQLAGVPKASFTHVIAWAVVRALREAPRLMSFFEQREGPVRVQPAALNLGIAVDVEGPSGVRTLVVPNLPAVGTRGFKVFLANYADLVARARKGKLTPKDFKDTTVTLTNPGTLGTLSSVPRLMPGQGLIVATGAITLPAGFQSVAPEVLTELGIGRSMTITSTYDHRIIQGAESGLFLARVDELLQGADAFYEELFADVRCPHPPFALTQDTNQRFLSERRLSMAEAIEKQARVVQLVRAFRVRGCLIADLDPLIYSPELHAELSLEHYGLSLWDLDRMFMTGGLGGRPMATLRDILQILQDTYCRRIGVEYMHISGPDQRTWLQDRMEPHRNLESFAPRAQRRILQKLNAAEAFEKFLHTRYVGQKRFSLEGAETLIPMLDALLTRAARMGVRNVVMGMSHRGRLNVLVNIFNKAYEQVFSEFESVVDPASFQGSGDVKYHLGARGQHRVPEEDGVPDVPPLPVLLASNPSHLEAVNPVVEGIARALQAQETSGVHEVLPVLLHGDAAFAGQGVVAETLNMSQLPGYKTGGTIHVIINNQIGYTAGPKQTRSTRFCTDMAKSIEAPILHVNGDFPESALRAIHIALDYREQFQRDVVVDLVCYRRHGHNETDEPAYTQPILYKRIEGHPSVRERYGALLVERGQMTEGEREASSEAFSLELKAALDAVKKSAPLPEPSPRIHVQEDPRDTTVPPAPRTGVDAKTLETILARALDPPAGHVVHPKLARQLSRRLEMLRGAHPIDWGSGEALAFGSLLLEGIPIRLAGQDSGRGTFSQRHAVLRDQITAEDWIPLNHLSKTQARFEVVDSLLSEEAAVAYEYGFATAAPEHLVIWEAQFGDFANGAQIPIDQFIAPSEAKWNLTSGVVLLLPHGYDGQGPEHSSARPERFLQLCAEGNMTIANCTTPAQYFHLLRRHAHVRPPRPLVVFTPKSLLRKKEAGSARDDFVSGGFEPVLRDPRISDASRVLLCTGKVYYDLFEARSGLQRSDVAIVRLEQLYPFPWDALLEALEPHKDAEVLWVQEEPRNMGAWSHVQSFLLDRGIRIGYVGRQRAASPATGFSTTHRAEQDHIVAQALTANRRTTPAP